MVNLGLNTLFAFQQPILMVTVFMLNGIGVMEQVLIGVDLSPQVRKYVNPINGLKVENI